MVAPKLYSFFRYPRKKQGVIHGSGTRGGGPNRSRATAFLRKRLPLLRARAIGIDRLARYLRFLLQQTAYFANAGRRI